MTEEKEDKTYDLEDRLINICYQHKNCKKAKEKDLIIGFHLLKMDRA